MDPQSQTQIIAITVVVLIFGGFIFLIIWLMRWQKKRVWTQMGQIADALNIPLEGRDDKKFFKPQPFLSGKHKTRQLNIHSEIRGTGKSRHYVTILKIVCSAHTDNTLTVWKEGFFSKIGKALGMQDIQTGFDEFDKQFVLRSNNPDFALKIFNQKICDKFLDSAPSVAGNLYFEKGYFTVTVQALIVNDRIRNQFMTAIDLFTLLAERVENLPRS